VPRGEEYSSYSFLTSALDRGEWSSSHPSHAPPPPLPERTSHTYCTRGWVSLRAGLDKMATGKILCPCQESNPGHTICSQILYWLSHLRSYEYRYHLIITVTFLWEKPEFLIWMFYFWKLQPFWNKEIPSMRLMNFTYAMFSPSLPGLSLRCSVWHKYTRNCHTISKWCTCLFCLFICFLFFQNTNLTFTAVVEY
jgi:hypothetical protein